MTDTSPDQRPIPNGDPSPSPHVVDARGLACPMPVIELAKRIDSINIGEHVLLLANDPAARVDVPVWCRMQRQRLIRMDEHNGVVECFIERVR